MKQSNSRSTHRLPLNPLATGVRRVLAPRAFLAGVAFGDTSLSVYVNNATDENAELTRFSRGGDERIVANRPRSVGLSLSRRF